MKRILLPALVLLALSSCYNDNYEELYPNPCNTDSVTYSGTVSPILVTNCASASGCHKSKAVDPTNFTVVELDQYAGAKAAAGGNLLNVINHVSGFSAMPKNNSKMDDCTISKISKWVADGAPQN